MSHQPRSWTAAKNSLYALIEFAWPAVLSLLATPVLVRGLGTSAYGVFSLIAVTSGFFALLDLGIGGAAIRSLAQTLARSDTQAAARVMGTVLSIYAGIGVIGGAAMALVAPLLVRTVLDIPPDMHDEATLAFVVAAVGFPLSLLAGALASALKAAQRFDLSTRIAVVMATLTPVTWITVVLSGQGLPSMLAASSAISGLGAIAYWRQARRLVAPQRVILRPDLTVVREIGHFASWYLVAGIGVTVLYQLDKLLLGSFLSVAAVTYYVVPGNVATRIQGLMGAATQVVFPASSALLARGDLDASRKLYLNGTRLLFLLGASLAVPVAMFSHAFLAAWMGPAFAKQSGPVMVVLAGTYLLLGLTGVPWGLAFGAGRARANAIFVLGMGAVDVVLFLQLVPVHGLLGAAWAFFLGAAIGVPVLIVYAERSILGLSGIAFVTQYARVLPAVAATGLTSLLLQPLATSLVRTVIAMLVAATAAPILYLLLGFATPDERALLGRLGEALRRLARRPQGTE